MWMTQLCLIVVILMKKLEFRWNRILNEFVYQTNPVLRNNMFLNVKSY